MEEGPELVDDGIGNFHRAARHHLVDQEADQVLRGFLVGQYPSLAQIAGKRPRLAGDRVLVERLKQLIERIAQLFAPNFGIVEQQLGNRPESFGQLHGADRESSRAAQHQISPFLQYWQVDFDEFLTVLPAHKLRWLHAYVYLEWHILLYSANGSLRAWASGTLPRPRRLGAPRRPL